MIDLDKIIVLAKAAYYLITAALLIHMYIVNKDKVTNAKFSDLEKSLLAIVESLEKTLSESLKEAIQSIKKYVAAFEEKTERRLDNHASRIKYLEACAEKAPSHKDLAEVYNAINGLASKVDKTSGQMDAVKATLGRMEQHLMNQAIVNQSNKKE